MLYKQLYPDRISVRLLEEELPYNMAIGDEKMYRYETDTENFKAHCCFNDPEGAKKLIEKFKLLSTLSTIYNC